MFLYTEPTKLVIISKDRSEAATGGVLSKNVFLKILEASQESFFNKIARLQLC